MARGLAGLCAALFAALAASGCGTVGLSEAGSGDVTSGKKLFTASCGSCHVLADAGTKGQIGPNLDDAFEQSRADGLGESTIQTVVRGQIAYPVQEPSPGGPGMPADIVEGEDAEDVAAYVASVAGKPTAGTPDSGADTSGSTPKVGAGSGPDGAEVFASAGCGGCHTLDAAGSKGNIGPNLDDAKPAKDLVLERVTKGMGAMPSFADSLTPEEIAAVADYVSTIAGG